MQFNNITFSGGFTYTESAIPNINFLIVAGGGGGGYGGGGGGGAGGLLSGTAMISSGTTYTVSVGAGGVGGTSSAPPTNSGSNSIAFGLTAIGGGGGGGGYNGNSNVGGSGGSGGGASKDVGSASFGAGTPGQGNNGGAATVSGSGGAGGGGGAGSAGGNGGGSEATGAAGIGVASSITGSAVYYAGGGGAGGNGHQTNGGTGGGGNGSGTSGTPGSAGSTNTGGGGGGGPWPGGGGNGGSGIVIISFPVAYGLASSFTGGATLTVANGFNIYTFTTSGTISWYPILDYLIVGGGGGGGHNFGGGGGAGGLLTATNAITSSKGSSYAITIGTGGAGASSASGVTGTNGTNSSIANTTSGSVSLNGSSQYLTLASNAALNLTANFTVETWVYATTTTNSVDQVFNYGNFIFMLYHNGTTWTVEIGNGSSNYFTLVGTASLNAWHHFAITRSTNTYTLWIDGVQAATNTSSGAPATSGATLYIGKSAGGQWFTGYISNFRIVNGTAVYTGAFTPPINPLTITQNAGTNIAAITSITSTSLLLNTVPGTNFLVDSSTNNFTVTNNGTATSSTSNPFTIAAIGGGGGGTSAGGVVTGLLGGSGGGGSGYGTSSGGAGTSGQGNSGGSASGSGYISGGGGGGAGAAGTTVTSTSTPGNGGAGSVTTFYGSNLGGISFNGSSSYLTAGTNTNWTFLHNGLSDYTVEAWIWVNDTATAYTILSTDAASASIGVNVAVNNSGAGTIEMSIYKGVTGQSITFATATGKISAQVWTHIAFTFVSSTKTGTWYVNGINVASSAQPSFAYSASAPTYNLAIGRYQYSAPAGYFNGYISNLRIVNGIAVYTGNFTVPTGPLSSTQNASTNINAIINTTPTYSDSFNGTSQYLTYTPGTSVSFGTSNFTVEMWIYPTTTPTTPILLDARNSSTTNTWALGWGTGSASSGQLCWAGYTGSISVYDTTTSRITAGSWYHIAYCRSGTTGYLFVNGVQVATGTDNSNYNVTSPIVHIGSQYTPTLYFPGYISNLRIVNGTAVYTGNFTPPTSPLTVAQGAGTNIAALPNSTPTYSDSFNGSSQYLTLPINAAIVSPGATYTFEAWLYPTSFSGTPIVYQVTNTATVNWGGLLWQLSTTGQIQYQIRASTGGTNYSFTTTQTLTLNTWSHVALVINSNSLTIFINGVATSVLNATGFSALDGTQTFAAIGNLTNGYTPSGPYSGYISNFRYVKGTAVYTGNFTPPTSPLTATQSAGTNIAAITGTQTSLLTAQSSTIVDNSSYAFSITNNGTVTTTNTTQPFPVTVLLTAQSSTIVDNGPYAFSITNNGSVTITNSIQPFGYTALLLNTVYGSSYLTDASINNFTITNNGAAVSLPYNPFYSIAYAGGGGGGAYSSTTPGIGGLGGGGAGTASTNAAGTAGTANTGGGGGGGGGGGSGSNTTGSGGSGIVIIRYPTTYPLPSSITGSPSYTILNGYYIYAWTSSGTITF